MNKFRLFARNERGELLPDIAKAGAAIAFLSVISANFLSVQTAKLDKDTLSQVAAAASRGRPVDPLVTGSLQKAAGDTRLDPCNIKR